MRHIRKLKEILAYGFTPQAMSRVRQRPPNSRAEEDIEAANACSPPLLKDRCMARIRANGNA